LLDEAEKKNHPGLMMIFSCLYLLFLLIFDISW